jgi:hypothetical protein
VIPPRRARLPILACLLASLIIHVTVVVPAFSATLQRSREAPSRAAQLAADDVEPPETAPPEVDLGIDASHHTTLTWVGYDEYREHLAQLADVEQAAFTLAPPAAEAVADAVADTEAVADAVAVTEAVADAVAVTDTFPVAVAPAEIGERAVGEPEPAPQTEPDRPSFQARVMSAVARIIEAGRRGEIAEPSALPSETSDEPRPGETAMKESDPSSIIDVPIEQIRLGRPVAREGLELRPRRPHFTAHLLVTSSPHNPLVEIVFRRDGVPVRAAIIESSGDARVDHAIEASLYRWRASGKRLLELEGEETLTVTLRIVL